MSTRDIQDHVENLYEVAISPELVSRIIDIVTDEVSAWQSRYQDVVYPNLFLNALFVKIRDLSSIRNKPDYLALGVNLNGDKEQLDLWILKYEGTKFWLNVLNELKNRGVNEISSPVARAFPAFPRPYRRCISGPTRNSVSSTLFATALPTSPGWKLFVDSTVPFGLSRDSRTFNDRQTRFRPEAARCLNQHSGLGPFEEYPPNRTGPLIEQ